MGFIDQKQNPHIESVVQFDENSRLEVHVRKKASDSFEQNRIRYTFQRSIECDRILLFIVYRFNDRKSIKGISIH